MWFGAGRGATDAVVALVGSGVGAALVAGGSSYRGTRSSAGEWGHMTIMYGGRQCRCGASGCLEAYVGAEGVLDRYRLAGGTVDGDEEAAFVELLESVRRSRRQRSSTTRSAIWLPGSRTWSTWSTPSGSSSAAGPDCCWARALPGRAPRWRSGKHALRQPVRAGLRSCCASSAATPSPSAPRPSPYYDYSATEASYRRVLDGPLLVGARRRRSRSGVGVALAELLPVTSRHLFACGFTRSCAACRSIAGRRCRCRSQSWTLAPSAVAAFATSRHLPRARIVPSPGRVHCWAAVPLQS